MRGTSICPTNPTNPNKPQDSAHSTQPFRIASLPSYLNWFCVFHFELRLWILGLIKFSLFCQRQESGQLVMSRPDFLFTSFRELAPLFSPTRCFRLKVPSTWLTGKVGSRLPSWLLFRRFKRKRIVEDCYSDFYKRLTRVQVRNEVQKCVRNFLNHFFHLWFFLLCDLVLSWWTFGHQSILFSVTK